MNSGPKLTLSERRQKALEETFTELIAEAMQLKRTIWLMLHTGSKTVTIDQEDMNPLWDLKFTRVDDSKTKLTITAALLPEPNEDQLSALWKELYFTNNPIELVRPTIEGMKDLPSGYLQARLLDVPAGSGRSPIMWDPSIKKWVNPPAPTQTPAPTLAQEPPNPPPAYAL